MSISIDLKRDAEGGESTTSKRLKLAVLAAEEEAVDNCHVESIKPLISAAYLVEEAVPSTPKIEKLVRNTRHHVSRILNGIDDRMVVVVGPCSIHDPVAAMEYAKQLKPLQTELAGQLLIIMRVYFEKPRTTIGWKGLINDPHLDGTYRINHGLQVGRKLLRDINEMGIPCAVEFLDTTSPQYIADLVRYSII